MLFLQNSRRASRQGRPSPCPQPYCRHGSHGGIRVPTRHCGTSHVNGMTVHHVRCIVNPAHHLQFVRVGRTWQRVQR
jgi:hypothetical protein